MRILQFLLILACCSKTAMAQQSLIPYLDKSDPLPQTITQFASYQKPTFQNKALGDTAYYTAFDSNSVQNWTIVNNNPNNFSWIWSKTILRGMFTPNYPTLNSSTASDGFIMLPADYYNTPMNTFNPVQMDTYIESDTIDLTFGGTRPNGIPAVLVSIQHSLSYCCSAANRLVLQVSTDDFVSYADFDATNGLLVNQSNVDTTIGVVTDTIDISSIAANETDIKVRILSEGNSHYIWMIDDFTVFEGDVTPNHFIALREPKLAFNQDLDYDYKPAYTKIPANLLNFPVSGKAYNGGPFPITNVLLEAEFKHLAYPNGAPGQGVVYTTVSDTLSLLAAAEDSNLVSLNPRFNSNLLGDYRARLHVGSDSFRLAVGGLDTAHIHFSVTDTSYAKFDGVFEGSTGTSSYVKNGLPGGTMNGDQLGTIFIVESNTGNGNHLIPTSISYWVSNNLSNLGVEFAPKIWKLDTSATTITFNEVATALIPYTLVAPISNPITVELDFGSAILNGLDTGIYLVGYEVTNTASGTNLELYNDVVSEQPQPPFATFINFAHAPGWGWVADNPGIQLNLGNLPITTSLAQQTEMSPSELKVWPNPNQGEFYLQAALNPADKYTLRLINVLGQEVYLEEIRQAEKLQKSFNFQAFDKGVYSIVIDGNTERQFSKLVIR